jgi:hypothetical protein
MWLQILLILLAIVGSSTNASNESSEGFFWGTYRPYPYVGLRCQSSFSPLIGLMWYKPSLPKPLDYTLRHECSYNDQLTAFGWTKHDGQGYATQILSDPENHVVLETQWVKLSSRHWALRVHGKGVDEVANNRSDLSLLWYVATPGNLTAAYAQLQLYRRLLDSED